MNPVALTPRQLLVLRVAEFYYQEGVDAIASVAKLKPHMVRYDLKEMIEANILTPCIHFNESCFGYYIFHVHMAAKLQDVPALERAFKLNSRVAYLGRQGGKRPLGATILSKRPEDLFATIDTLGRQAKVPFAQVAWCIEGEFYHYGGSRLLPENPMRFESVQKWDGERVEIDHADARLIQLMTRGRLIGASELARASGLATSTVQYRLKRLRDSGAILPRSILINYAALGFSAFDILIRCAGPAAELTKVLRAFCKASPGVEILIRCFGDWDFKIVVHAQTLTEVLELDDSLQRTLGDNLRSSLVVPLRGSIKIGDFPAEDYAH
jgi:DNA-binding Lrp family transcriptional regulator